MTTAQADFSLDDSEEMPKGFDLSACAVTECQGIKFTYDGLVQGSVPASLGVLWILQHEWIHAAKFDSCGARR